MHIEPRIGARPLIVLGGALLLVANLLLSRLGVDADYAVDVLPALLVFGTGVALCTVTAMVRPPAGSRLVAEVRSTA